jgi:AbiU2
MMRIWRDSGSKEREVMETIAPLFFSDMGKVLGEFLVIAACRITDPAVDRSGNQNFSLELFANSFPQDGDAFKQLDALRQRMNKLRDKVSLARRKLGAHADREVIRKGEPLPAGSRKDWDDFWSALRDFVRVLNEKASGKSFEINAADVRADAESLLKALKQSQDFESLLKSDDATVKDACLTIAVPQG